MPMIAAKLLRCGLVISTWIVAAIALALSLKPLRAAVERTKEFAADA